MSAPVLDTKITRDSESFCANAAHNRALMVCLLDPGSPFLKIGQPSAHKVFGPELIGAA